ncbi:DUF6518 family protein [Paenibacillus sp. R14(2021)]|uniref:DUF6518 family protein n=1 Tax=Paenibacillus sp. R14(2021) TaxID=2859228 RepID=UPI001C6118DA|nr:DUF6518 family protein [Paenibacillus sp. R14(2021)]
MKRSSFGAYLIVSAIAGLLVGIATVLGQGLLPGNWNSLANSGAVWLVPAFFLGGIGTSKTRAAAGGVISLIGMVAGYYGYARFVQHMPHSLYFVIVWLVAAVVGGVIFGLGGYLWGRKYGSALLGGVFVTEGLNIFLHEGYDHMHGFGAAELVIGIALVLVIERSNWARFISLAAMVPVVVLGLLGYGLLASITG